MIRYAAYLIRNAAGSSPGSVAGHAGLVKREEMSIMSAPRKINPTEIKLPGRPRCEETRGAILRAAYELL